MVNSNANALGIIFPNSYDEYVPDLVAERLMASIPFAGRYRLIDFILSSMVNCGIDNVSIVVRKNYHSLMDHLGSGREWDLTRKNGGLSIFPPFAERSDNLYTGRVEALESIMGFLKGQKEEYVVMSDANMAVNFDFSDMLEKHIASGADVTIAYKKEEIPDAMIRAEGLTKGLYYTLQVEEDGRISDIKVNPKDAGIQNLSMTFYVLRRELLISLIESAYVNAHLYFERDVLMHKMDELKIFGYEFTGYTARITGLHSYFEENMKLLDEKNLDELFSPNPVYTKIRDDNPTRYISGAKVKNIMAADGCVIEGEVENSVLFRGVKVAKGAKVKNCVLMQDTVVEAGAQIEYVVTDKQVVITEGKEMKGTDTYPMFVAKGKRV